LRLVGAGSFKIEPLVVIILRISSTGISYTGDDYTGNFYVLLAFGAYEPLTGKAVSGSQALVTFGAEEFKRLV
jgi:hypothetical protein